MSDQEFLRKLRYILYVIPTDVNCIRAQRLVPKQARIFVQDISQLPTRPQFLNGVPFLVRLDDDKMFRGSEALQELQRYWKLLDAHFNLESEPSMKVGYLNGPNAANVAVSYPLIAPGAPPPPSVVVMQQPSTLTLVQPQQPTAVGPTPFLPLPQPNINTDGVIQQTTLNAPAVPQGVPGFPVDPLQQALQQQQRKKVDPNTVIPLPPRQDDPNAPLNFNPLHQNIGGGVAPGALPPPTGGGTTPAIGPPVQLQVPQQPQQPQQPPPLPVMTPPPPLRPTRTTGRNRATGPQAAATVSPPPSIVIQGVTESPEESGDE